MTLKIKFLTAASAVALLIAVDAGNAKSSDENIRQISFSNQTSASVSTENQKTDNQKDSYKSEIKSGADTEVEAKAKSQNDVDLEEDISSAANKAGEELQDGYENVKAAFTEDGSGNIRINTQASANKMIGQPVYTAENKRVGTVEDIILSREGNLENVVVADGGFLSIRDKKAAFDARTVNPRWVNGKLQMDLTEEMIENAQSFSYDRTKASKSVQTPEPGSVSVARLLDANIVGPDQEVLAEVDNIAFGAEGEADQLIIKYGQVMGMGGERAAINFNTARLVDEEGGKKAQFQLTGNQAVELKRMQEKE
jgi:sporulation protein YlmC with PRC-barrel domain